MSLLLESFLSGEIYLDTMIFYIFLRTDPKIRPIIGEFFTRIEERAVVAYTSVLTFDELAYRLLLALIKDKYGSSPLKLLRESEEQMLREFSPVIVPKLLMLKSFPLSIVDLTADDLGVMIRLMADHPIRPRDALHLAAMYKAGCTNLASNDHHFDVIPELCRFAVVPPN